MAIKNVENVKLKLVLDGGVVDGKIKRINKTYSGVKEDATVDAIFNTSKEIVELQNKRVLNVLRIEEAILTE
ncbi:MAG: hypothetical protein Q4P34_06705 [Tissierellia bacterium]|nr:hypothetical protein [Tissierellia bacterium]